MDNNKDHSDDARRKDQPQKKKYTPPRLIRHGTVEDITGNVGLNSNDGITGSQL